MNENSTPNVSLQKLFDAANRPDVTRRDLVKIAGAAAMAAGLVGPFGHIRNASAQDIDSTVFIYGSGQDITTLDPHLGTDYSTEYGQRAVYDTLLRFEGIPPVTHPLVASAVTSNDDASVWTATLDPAAVFPDGSAVDAEVVKWNIERLLTKNLGYSWMFADIMTVDSVEIVDAQTINFNLTKSFAPFDLTLPWIFLANPAVVAENTVDGDDETWLIDHAAGSGPYEISRWEPGNLYEFTRRADYWFSTPGIEQPIETFIWRITRESSTRRIALETGEITYGDWFSLEDQLALAETDGITGNNNPGWGPLNIKLNNQVGPCSDVNVRKAITAALDYESVLAAVSGRAAILEGPLPSQLSPWWKEGLPVIKYDLEAARGYLEQSSYAGQQFDLEYVYVTDVVIEEQIGLILLDNLSQLGINLTISPVLWPDLVARVASADTAGDMVAVYSGINYLDPDAYLWPCYHSSQAGTWSASSHVISEDLDKLLEDARATSDQAARKELYDQAQTWLVENASEIFVYSETPNTAWRSELGPDGVEPAAADIRAITFRGV